MEAWLRAALVVLAVGAWQLGQGPNRNWIQHVAQRRREVAVGSWSRRVATWAKEEDDDAAEDLDERRRDELTVPLSESVRWLPQEAWIENWEQDDRAAYDEELELPLVAVDAPLLPTGTHWIAVTDVFLEKLYDEILLSGGRRFVVTLGERDQRGELAKGILSSVDDELEYAYNVAAMDGQAAEGSTPIADESGDVRLAETGCVLYLTDVKDNEAGTRVCEHTVQAQRVRIRKVVQEGGRMYCRASVVRDKETEPAFTETLPCGQTDDDDDDEATTTFAAMIARLESINGSIQELLHALSTRRQQQQRKSLEAAAARVDTSSLEARPQRKKKKNSNNLLINKGASTTNEPPYERLVLEELAEIAKLQKRLDEDVCFREEAIGALGAGVGSGVGSLWHLANSCWLSYLKARATTRARRIYAELHDRLVEFLARTGRLPPEFFAGREGLVLAEHKPEFALSVSELPSELQRDLLRLKARVADELEPIIGQHKAAQLLLEAPNHEARCHAFASLLRSEKRRLQARAALRNALAPLPSASQPRSSFYPRGELSDDF